ncbi:hypothetical protein KBZ33_02540 [Cyanobium sp. Cruz-8D1]|uniref:hypothetical protein n=1 Tax=Cyanobium sp. Cruz-8D1 TaxID=2823711 RepID=UPI0020CE41E6|nr:hypothetical protein [Cyanobium sp. Cruz-8D1]MCP9857759.1 hypothetical protein [Cyanobium sp. Cruz-8H5]MCP9865183.1 hypothetical protein [Cyanobium sp. Cruz-8D1]
MAADNSATDRSPDPAKEVTSSAPPADRKLALIRFAVRAVRVTASTIAVVALLRQQWVAAAAFSVAWLLILGSPRVFPLLQDPAEAP